MNRIGTTLVGDERVPGPGPGARCPVCGASHALPVGAEVVPCLECGAWCRVAVGEPEDSSPGVPRLRPVTVLSLTLEGSSRPPSRCYRTETTIGGPGCDLVLPGLAAGEPAAIVLRDGEAFRIRAQAGQIRLDGERLREAPLGDGSKVEIGPHALLVGLLGPWDSQPAAAELTLHVSRGPDRGKRFVVSDEMVAGRSDGCGIQLRDRDVSRRHARFVRRGSSFIVQDLGSTNGTRIGGRRVAMALIRGEAQIQLGEDVLVARVTPLDRQLAPATEAPLALEIVDGPGKGRIFSCKGTPVVIGAGEADVKLPDAKVSSGHAVIERHGESFLLRDLESRSGTYVDEQRVAAAPLFHGSRIDVGGTTLRATLAPASPERSRPEMFKVVWRARILADDAVGAARQAWDLMRRGSPTSLRYLAIHAVTGAAMVIDLGEPAGPLHLVVTAGPDLGAHVCVQHSPSTIGREAADVVLGDPRLSRAHAVFERHGAGWFLRDLGSRHGSWVDGQRVRLAEVRDGSRVGLGDTAFLVRLPDSAAHLVNERPALDVSSSAQCFDVMWACRKPGKSPVDACRSARELQRDGASHVIAVDDPVKQERRFFVLQARADELVEVGEPPDGLTGIQ